MEDKAVSKENIKHKEAHKTLKTAQGHLNAVVKMVENNRYCIDISTQLMAVVSLLKKANMQVLSKHMETCIKDAVLSKSQEDIDEKIEEIKEVIKYLNKI